MKRISLVFLFAALAAFLAAAPGCGSDSNGKKASAKSTKGKSKKKKTDEDPQRKGYKPPQNVWGPDMLDEYMKNLDHSDPKERALAWKGLFNTSRLAKTNLAELKKRYAKEKDKTVKAEAKKAIKRIENS